MINNSSSFLFVTGENPDADHPNGDLDRIDLSASVMPLRSSSDKGLYGIDLAFLLEAACERSKAAYSNDDPRPNDIVTFTRNISLRQIRLIDEKTRSSLTSSRWLCDYQYMANEWVQNGSVTFADLAPHEIENGQGLHSVSEIYASGNIDIDNRTVRKLFENARRLFAFVRCSTETGSGFPLSSIRWSDSNDDYDVSYVHSRRHTLANVPTVYAHYASGVTDNQDDGSETDHTLKGSKTSTWTLKYSDGSDDHFILLHVEASSNYSPRVHGYYVAYVPSYSSVIRYGAVVGIVQNLLSDLGITLLHCGDGNADSDPISQSVSVQIVKVFARCNLRNRTKWW